MFLLTPRSSLYWWLFSDHILFIKTTEIAYIRPPETGIGGPL